jgi:hypothetical protein
MHRFEIDQLHRVAAEHLWPMAKIDRIGVITAVRDES